MSKKLQLFCIALLASVFLKAQSPPPPEYSPSRTSATGVPSQKWNEWFNQEVEKYLKANNYNKTSTQTYYIPVIFHVLHAGEAVGTYPNLSVASITSQVSVLNADYAGIGLNVGNVPSQFASLVSNTGIQFCLAVANPVGSILPEPGIDRINVNSQGWASPSATNNIVSYIENTVKPVVAGSWTPIKYLNIYVSDRSATLNVLSYATYPAGTSLAGIPSNTGTATSDGIWCYSKVIGNIGLPAPHDRGRILTKEVAHWLGVRNIWGDGNCLDDYCSDTPWAKQPNTGCPSYPSFINRCGINQSPDGEMTMNFMDETDDACKYMFTPRQAIRMQTAMSQCNFRNQLGTHNLCVQAIRPAANAVASFFFNEIPCVGQPITPQNNSTGWPLPTFQWSSAPNTVISPAPSVASPAIFFPGPGTYTLYMTATNTANIASFSMVVTPLATCPATMLCLDTIRIIRKTDSLITYKAPNNSLISGCQTGFAGYLSGSNCYGDKEFAQFIPASSYSAISLPQVNSVIVLFDSLGTKSSPGQPATQVSCVLYTGTSLGGPNSQFAVKSDSLKTIISTNRKTRNIKYLGIPTQTLVTSKIIPFKFDFASPIIITSGTPGFYASVTVPYLTTSVGDSVRIYTNKLNSQSDSSAWVLLNPSNNWRTIKGARNAKVQLAILPQMTCRPAVGIKENISEFNSNITIMPNPSTGEFSLIFTLPTEQFVNFKIYNAIGQQITSGQFEDVTSNIINVNLSGKPNGIYFIEISNGTERVTRKIVIGH